MSSDDRRSVILTIVIVLLCCLSAYSGCQYARHNPVDDPLVVCPEPVAEVEVIDSFTMPEGYFVSSIDFDWRGGAVEVMMWHRDLARPSFVAMELDSVLRELAAPLKAEVEARYLDGGK